MKLKYKRNDGGRAAAGFKGRYAGDCGVRAIAIVTGYPYRIVTQIAKSASDLLTSGIRTTVNNGMGVETMNLVIQALGAERPVVCKGKKGSKDFTDLVDRRYQEVYLLEEMRDSNGNRLDYADYHPNAQSTVANLYPTLISHFGSNVTIKNEVVPDSISNRYDVEVPKYLEDIPRLGTYIVLLAGHYVAVVNGEVQDSWNSVESNRTKNGSPKIKAIWDCTVMRPSRKPCFIKPLKTAWHERVDRYVGVAGCDWEQVSEHDDHNDIFGLTWGVMVKKELRKQDQ